jgi:hypothetical protein
MADRHEEEDGIDEGKHCTFIQSFVEIPVCTTVKLFAHFVERNFVSLIALHIVQIV